MSYPFIIGKAGKLIGMLWWDSVQTEMPASLCLREYTLNVPSKTFELINVEIFQNSV